MTHIPTPEQCRAARPSLESASRTVELSFVGEHSRKGLAEDFADAAAALGYTLQSPDDVAREKALMEAAKAYTYVFPSAFRLKPIGAENSSARQQQNEQIAAEDALHFALAAYDPPTVTSAPGAPHDGEMKP